MSTPSECEQLQIFFTLKVPGAGVGMSSYQRVLNPPCIPSGLMGMRPLNKTPVLNRLKLVRIKSLHTYGVW
jgi:hypothetical protein